MPGSARETKFDLTMHIEVPSLKYIDCYGFYLGSPTSILSLWQLLLKKKQTEY